jgi:hypothetical protein
MVGKPLHLNTKDWATRTPLKTGCELGCSGRASSSFSTSCIRRVTLLTKDGGKSWMKNETWDCDYDKQNISVIICDTDIPYDKQNISVIFCDTDIPYDTQNISLSSVTQTFHSGFLSWWRPQNFRRDDFNLTTRNP